MTSDNSTRGRILVGTIRSVPENTAQFFHVCGDCGQAFDLRSLAQVMHHDKSGHKPLTEAELSELRQ